MKGIFRNIYRRQGRLESRGEWINNAINTDFHAFLAQIMSDLIGNYQNLSTLAGHGFYMAVGPGSTQSENAMAEFKKNVEAMEKMATSPDSDQKTGFYSGKYRGRQEVLYTVNNQVYYSINLLPEDLNLNQSRLGIEATLEEKNPRTNGLKIGEFGIYTKYPANSQSLYLLNYGRHSEIRKDDDLTLSRKIEFIF